MSLTAQEKAEILDRHRRFEEDRKAFAQRMLENIANGWAFSEAHGHEEMRDVTAERKAHYEREIVEADRRMAEYEKWYA